MLPYLGEKVKGWAGDNRADLFTALMVFLIGIASFGLGRLSVTLPEKEPIRLEEAPSSVEGAARSQSSPASNKELPSGGSAIDLTRGQFVASKSGSVYYAVWCAGASRIRVENKIWFQTKEDAEAKGYRIAKNC